MSASGTSGSDMTDLVAGVTLPSVRGSVWWSSLLLGEVGDGHVGNLLDQIFDVVVCWLWTSEISLGALVTLVGFAAAISLEMSNDTTVVALDRRTRGNLTGRALES